MNFYYYEIIACQLAKCQPQMLFVRTRKREVVFARQMCMYYRHKELKMSQAAAAARYGLDHATTIHAIKTLNNLKETEPKIRDIVNSFIARSNNAKKEWQKEKEKEIYRKVGIVGTKGYVDSIVSNFMVLAYHLNNFSEGFGDEDAIRTQLCITENDVIDMKILFKTIEQLSIDNGIID